MLENRLPSRGVPDVTELRIAAGVVFCAGRTAKEAAMNLFAKVVLWVVLSSFVAVGAKAQSTTKSTPSGDVQAARMVICSSAEKAQHFATQHQDVQAAIASDETSTGKDTSGAASACLVAGIAYISGKPMDRVTSKDGAYEVTEILIVGVATPYGMLAIEPSVVYTLLKVDEERA